MKKLLYNMVLFIVFMLPISVFASGGISTSTSSLTIEVGSSKTFTISAYNTIGDVSIKSNNTSVAVVNTSEWGTGMVGEGETKTGTITVTGKSVGSSTITLTIDAATFDGEDLSLKTKTISVNVIAKSTIVKPNKIENTSTNNKVKELSIDFYNVTKVDDNNYKLDVGKDISNININVVKENSKAIIKGDGEHNVNIGENKFEIVVTSESGSDNIINVIINRRDYNTIEDLNYLLSNIKDNNIIVNIDLDSKLSSEDINNIKNSNKIVELNYYSDSDKLIYSWKLDGSKINNIEEFLTSVSYDTDNSIVIRELSNNYGNVVISVKNNFIPEGTYLKVLLGNNISKNIKLYYYNKDNNKLDLINDDIKVKDGYIEFMIDKGNDYLVETDISNSNSINISKGLFISLLIIVLLVLCSFVIIKVRKNKKRNN